VIDDTGFPKFGKMSVGVARQYSGALGKVGNCQIGVSINACSDEASCPLDWRLFIPEEWDEDSEFNRDRRAKAKLPDDVHHTEKWRLALVMIDELIGWGIEPPVVLGDGAYGDITEFRSGLEDRELSMCWTSRAAPPPTARTSDPSGRSGRAPGGHPSRVIARTPPRSKSWRSPPARRPR
jgi:SRSO17 transposase